MIDRTMPTLDAVTAAEAYEWLQENMNEYAQAIASEVKRGAKADAIFYHLLDRLGSDRRALAIRCRLAAEHLQSADG